MAREILERDLDLNGLACFNPRTATLPNDVICLRDMPTFTSGLTQNPVTKVVTGDYITGKAGGQLWTGGTAANDNLTIQTTNAANPTGTLGFIAPHTTWTVDQTVVSASGATLDAIKVNAPTITLSGSTNITTPTGFNVMTLPVTTLTSVSPITVTSAATLMIAGPPTYAGNTFITSRYALWVQSGGIRIDGADDSNAAIYFNRLGEQDIIKTRGVLAVGTADNWDLSFSTNNQGRFIVKANGTTLFTNRGDFTIVNGVGVAYRMDQTIASASSATLDNILHDTSTITFTGSTPITTANGVNQSTYAVPTYTSAFGVAITNAATVAISGAPAVSGATTITNPYALWVQAGRTYLAGSVQIQSLTGVLKATSGVVSVGTGGTDFEFPLTFSQGLTRAVNAVTGDYITGKTGNFTWTGSLDAAGTLNIRSSSNAAPGSLTLTGGPIRFSAGGISVASSAGAVLDAISVPATSVTVTGTTAINTSNGFNFVSINGPTYTDASAVTIANAATFVINGGPINGGSATITNSYALWVQGTNGNSLFGGRVWMGSVVSAAVTNQFYSQSSQSVASGAGATLDSSLWDSATTTISGSTTIATANGFNQNTFKAPVFNGASVTITNAATVAISGAPTGTATITNPFAFWVQGGTSKLGGTVIIQALTGMLKGTSGTVSVATPGTDYQAALTPADATIAFPTGSTIKVNQLSNKFIVQGTADSMLTGAQFLGALVTGLLKSTTTTGVLSIATAGTDFESPLIFSTGLTRNVNTITDDLATGKAGGLTATGGTAASESLTLQSTTNATKGRILNGSWFALDEVNNRVLIGTQTAGVGAPLTIASVDSGGNLRAIHLTRSGEQDVMKTGGLFAIGTTDGQTLCFDTNNTQRISINATGQVIHTNRGSIGTVTSGNGAVFRYDASLTASAALTWDALLFDAATLTLSGGTAITTPLGLNYAVFKAPTYSGTTTITSAATVAISGAPIASGTTITQSYALWVQADKARFEGQTIMAGLVFIQALTGVLKANAGQVGVATVGTDYEAPLTFSTGLTRSVNTITANISTGVSGGQTAIGGTASGESLTLQSTSHATKGRVLNGSWFALDEVNQRLLIGTQTAGVGAPLTINSVDSGGNLWAIRLTASSEQDIIKSGGSLVFGTSDANTLFFSTGNQARVSINSSGNVIAGNGTLGALATGNGIAFRYAQSITAASGSTLDDILFDAVTILMSGTTPITTSTGFNFATFKAPFITGSGTIISKAATVAISGAPTMGGSTTITNPYALWLQGGVLTISGTDASTRAIWFDKSGEQDIIKSGGIFVIGTSDANTLYLSTNNQAKVLINSSGQMIHSNQASLGSLTSGNGFVARFDATVSQVAGSTLDTILFDTALITLTGGATSITTAAGFNYITIKRPTYANASAMNITNAATLAIAGPPAIGGAGPSITNNYALWVQSGLSRFDGDGFGAVFEVTQSTPPQSPGAFLWYKMRLIGDARDYYVQAWFIGS